MSQALQKPEKTDRGKLREFLCFGIYSANLALAKVYKPLLEELGLTYPQYLAMVLLWERDGRTIKELGEALFLESNTVTPLIKRLEAAGYVERRRDSEDERVVRVSLTEKGRAAETVGCLIPDKIVEASGMTAEAMSEMNADLARLRDHIRAEID